MFQTVQPGKKFVLVRNPNWDPSTDPVRKALPDEIDVALKQNQDDIDNRLHRRHLDVDVTGSGVAAADPGARSCATRS